MHGDQPIQVVPEVNNDEPPHRTISVKRKQMPADEMREIHVNLSQRNLSHHNIQSLAQTHESSQSSSQSTTSNNGRLENGRHSIVYPEAETGVVALPAENAAETEAVLQAIAEDKKRGEKSDSDNEAEEILEESPDKRWSKRREKVKQRDVPGIDVSYLAMDNETGNEVVWNEVQFSERKNFRDQEEKIRAVFDDLTHLDHVNLVKFHKYWTDSKSEKPRIIFITEYMSSGSMSRFLQRARSSETLSNIRMWKKWTIQILSALNYLHSCDPPIAHANLSCNTIFIQQNGLIKIGCVAPNAIHHHVKTFKENIRNMHYIAPEYEYINDVTTKADIYSFGICALEMATRGGLSSNGDSQNAVSQENIRKVLDSLDSTLQKDFISECLNTDPDLRPTARELLFHPVLFEVHSLKLIAAHVMINSKLYEHLSEDDLRITDSSRLALDFGNHTYSYAQLESIQASRIDLDKFLEDVKNGIYPLFAFAQKKAFKQSKSSSRIKMSSEQNEQEGGMSTRKSSTDNGRLIESISSASIHRVELNGESTTHLTEMPTTLVTPASTESFGKQTGHDSSPASTITSNASCPSTIDHNSTIGSMQSSSSDKPQGETRLIVQMKAGVKDKLLSMFLQLDDRMNRQLTTEVFPNDRAEDMVAELIIHGFICENDSDKVCALLIKVLEDFHEDQEKMHGDKTVSSLDDTDENDSSKYYSPPRVRATPEELTDDSSPPISMVAPKSSPEDYR